MPNNNNNEDNLINIDSYIKFFEEYEDKFYIPNPNNVDPELRELGKRAAEHAVSSFYQRLIKN